MLNWRREFEKRFLKRGWAMSGKFKFTLLFLLLSTVAFSHSNQWIQIQSRLTGEELKASVVLPPGYEEDARRYPVLYFLHGWNQALLICSCSSIGVSCWLSCVPRERLAFIIVIPESGDAGRSWYSDYTTARIRRLSHQRADSLYRPNFAPSHAKRERHSRLFHGRFRCFQAHCQVSSSFRFCKLRFWDLEP